ncbi:MAG: LLM class flavin-dependent oxidoreductase [Gammaproteobacteria bacterium]|nr:LLM class flavin-dependent oxidoreductase [Gammaproteobacteria bacterium]
MEFGVFDHMDRGDLPVNQQYRDRLALIEAYDRAGFYGYHLAEHHGTPLGLAPSPNMFLAAVAERSHRLRFGPLVYTMSIYHPLRLLEEICMLDQLSGGRLEIGLGRGISPIEMGFYGVGQESQEIYEEVRDIVLQGLTHERLDFRGKYFNFEAVPLVIRPLQTPHPPLWYGVGRPESTRWTAEHRINIVTNGLASAVRAITDQYRAEWSRLGNPAATLPRFGMNRHVVVAESEADAIAAARPAYRLWFDSLLYLWRLRGMQIPLNFPEDFDEARAAGLCVVGSVATVRDRLKREAEAAGINYLLCRFAFGNLPQAMSLQSVALMRREIMPAF